MTRFSRTVALVAALAAPVPALAQDDVEQALEAALEAYRAGDIALAQDEVDFAAGLLKQKAASSLSSLLPAALEGWTAEDGEAAAAGAGMAAMFGGGLAANRTYEKAGDHVEITVMADNPMVAQMAAMFTNPAMLGQAGTLKRLNGQRVAISDGELTALIANRFLVQVSGSAPLEAKEAYFEAIDIDALKAF
jgi:hypothetical protein